MTQYIPSLWIILKKINVRKYLNSWENVCAVRSVSCCVSCVWASAGNSQGCSLSVKEQATHYQPNPVMSGPTAHLWQEPGGNPTLDCLSQVYKKKNTTHQFCFTRSTKEHFTLALIFTPDFPRIGNKAVVYVKAELRMKGRATFEHVCVGDSDRSSSQDSYYTDKLHVCHVCVYRRWLLLGEKQTDKPRTGPEKWGKPWF